MSPAIVLASNSGEDTSGDDDEEEQAPIVTPKGKHLWCQEDSYGYTKGDCFLAVSLPSLNVCFRENFKRDEEELS